MPVGQRNVGQIIWGVLLIAMGLLLCVKEPYALRAAPVSGFLSFARYFIAAVLIVAGGKKLHRYYFFKPPSDE
jgi:hypothetical protein